MQGRRSAWRHALFAYVALFYGFLYGPMAMSVLLSFNDSVIFGFPLRGMTLRWYAIALTSPKLLDALWNSIAVGAIVAVASTALALSLALAFRHAFRGKSVILNLVMVPVVVPGIVGGIVLLLFFGYAGVPSSLYTTVIVGHINWVLPVAFFTIFPRVHGFDTGLEEAAMDLGARPGQIFRRIVLPIIRPGVIATALFSFSLSFDEFIRTLFLTGYDATIPVQFWSMITESVAPELPAMAVIIIAISVAVSLVAFAFAGRGTGRTA